MQRHRLLAPILALSAVLFGACTSPAPNPEDPQDPAAQESAAPETQFNEPPGGVTLMSGVGWRTAIQASETLFESSPAAVVASEGDAEALAVAADEVATEGVPILLVPGTDEEGARQVAEELARLGVEVLVSVGGAASALEPGDWEIAEAEPDAAAIGAQIPHLSSGTPPGDTAAIVVTGEENRAAAATVTAAGVPLLEVSEEEPNPQDSPEAIAFLGEHPGPSVLAIGNQFPDASVLDWQIRSARSGYELPGGGQHLFGPRQYVALYGTPGAPELGVLGQQDLDGAVERVREYADDYRDLTENEVVPSFEIIATIASSHAGEDGDYSIEVPPETLRPWVERAGEEGIKVILDLQPGRTDFLTQAKEYADLLKMPHVGLALDPEWRLEADQVHLRQIGSVSSSEVNEVTEWLADLVNEEGLPPKMLVLHQFRTSMITDRDDLEVSRPEVSLLIHADGQGTQSAKQETWRALHVDAPAGIGWGWKNFLEEDSPVLSPEQTIEQVDPVPDLITYQ